MLLFDSIAPVLLHDQIIAPALTIPTTSKDSFECPEDHVKVLTQVLRSVDRILTVGWRAAEANFLRLLSENLKRPVRLQVVAGGEEDAKAVDTAIRGAGIPVSETKLCPAGFSVFIGRRDVRWLAAVVETD